MHLFLFIFQNRSKEKSEKQIDSQAIKNDIINADKTITTQTK